MTTTPPLDAEDAARLTNDLPALTSTQVDLVREYQQARAEYDSVSALRKAAAEKVDRLEAAVLKMYEQSGASSIRVDGRLVYLIRKQWARPLAGREPELVGALIEAGYDDLVERRIGTQRLSAWVRECEREEESIPQAVRDLMEVAEVFSLGMKKGS